MAKSDAGEDDDKFVKMDADSLSFLEQVKKGKTRNFVLAVKGSIVSSLLLKKKAVNDKDRKEARGGGFQPVFGVLAGQGINITFTVARSDGFDESTAAIKTEKLKKYLKEQTGVAYKPEFVLVDTPPAIPFDEEDLAHPLVAKFLKLEPALPKYAINFPSMAGEIQRRASEVRSELLDDKTRDSAAPMIEDLVAYLKKLGSTTTPSPSNEPGPSSQTVNSSENTNQDDAARRVAKLTEGLKKLKPLVDQVIGSHPDRSTALTGLMTQIVTGIKSRQLDVAEAQMTELAKLVKTLLTSGPQPVASSNPALDAFRQRQQLLEPQLRECQQQTPDKSEALEKVWVFANMQAEDGKLDSAVQALDRLEQALKQLTGTPVQPQFSLKNWQRTTKYARFQLRRLQVVLRISNHPTAHQIVDVIDSLVKKLEASPGSPSEVSQMEEFLRNDATITSAEVPNPFGLEVKIRQPLLDAIEEVKLQLQA